MNGGGTHAISSDGAVRPPAGCVAPPPLNWRALARAERAARVMVPAQAPPPPAPTAKQRYEELAGDFASLLPPQGARDELEWFFCRAESQLGLRSTLGPMIEQLRTGHAGRNGGAAGGGAVFTDMLEDLARLRHISAALRAVPAVHRATLASYYEAYRVGRYMHVAFGRYAPVVVRLPAAHALYRELAGSRRARTLRVCELFEDVLDDGRLGEFLLTHVAVGARARRRYAKGYTLADRRAVLALAGPAELAVIAAFAAYEAAKERPPCTAPSARPVSASRPFIESESWLTAAE